jgi:hypothetical protein
MVVVTKCAGLYIVVHVHFFLHELLCTLQRVSDTEKLLNESSYEPLHWRRHARDKSFCTTVQCSHSRVRFFLRALQLEQCMKVHEQQNVRYHEYIRALTARETHRTAHTEWLESKGLTAHGNWQHLSKFDCLFDAIKRGCAEGSSTPYRFFQHRRCKLHVLVSRIRKMCQSLQRAGLLQLL